MVWKGASSLLFLPAVYKAYVTSNLLLWKFAMTNLVGWSVANNMYSSPILLKMDYFAIFILSLIYINHNLFYGGIIFSFFCYHKPLLLVHLKNGATGLAFVLAIWRSIHKLPLSICTVVGTTTYSLRLLIIDHDTLPYYLMTILWHICVASILWFCCDNA